VGRDDVCTYCGKKGHWAKECRNKKRNEAAQAHVTQGEEEEQSLLLAHDIILDKLTIVIVNTTAIPSSPSTTPRRVVHIEEQHVFADLGPIEENNHNHWVLDTGTTNHITGSRDISVELDSKICGTVKFGDGSITKIEG
jgi:hypothetical protein